MSAGRRAAALLGLLALLVGGRWSGSAVAQTDAVTAAEVAALARDAVDDDGALAELRAVDSVDGHPVDLEAATAELGDQRAGRLAALARAFEEGPAPGEGAAVDPAAAREQAEAVLDDDKFSEGRLPRPFKGILEWVADLLRPIGRALEPVLELVDGLPGGRLLLVGLLAALLGSIVWWAVARRSGASVAGAAAWHLVDPGQDPADLEGAADRAEAVGDHGAAVRLRYEAGLLRLARSGRASLHPDTTARDVARHVGDPTLDALTDAFEEVVYGGRPATASDSAAARSGWVEVLAVGARR